LKIPFDGLIGIGLVISDMKIAVVFEVLHKVVTHKEVTTYETERFC